MPSISENADCTQEAKPELHQHKARELSLLSDDPASEKVKIKALGTSR